MQMGVVSSKIEEDKALALCRERKRLVRQALDERCSLAAAHISYIQSLRNIGSAFINFVEPGASIESSLEASTSATEPLALTDKSTSQFSNSLPSLSQNVAPAESFSSVPSPHSSVCLHVNHMKAGKSSYRTVREKSPTSATAILQTSSASPKHLASQSDEISSFEAPPTPPGSHLWDYFGVNAIDNQLSFQSGRGLNHGFENADEIKCLREEEGIPDLEGGDRASTNEKNDLDSEDDFDRPSNEPLVQMFKNRNLVSENQLRGEHLTIQSMEHIVSETKHQNGDDMKITNGNYETNETPEATPTKVARQVVAFPINGKAKESNPETNLEARDLLSCMKEIKELFLKASESGSEVPRMLEANKVQFRPLFPEGKAHRSTSSAFLTACLTCCTQETPHPQASATNEIKCITWNRSVLSLSSSSGNFVGATTKDDKEDLNGNLFNRKCMNSGSHASTLDRLYAWEKKLYDEVKASGIVRREYDIKCRLLRHKESTGENPVNIDKIRAAVKDLHYRIRVAIQRIDSISKKIEEIRDMELQPQLEELIEGLTRMWRMMLDYHNCQCSIIKLACNNGSNKVLIRSELEHQATVLEFELNSLSSNFTEWMSAYKSYLQAINGWLLKFILVSPKRNNSSRKKDQAFCPKRDTAPPIFITCRDWLLLLDDLPTKEVVSAIKDLVTATTHFLPRQEKGHGTSKLSFSSLWKAEQSDEPGEDVHLNDSRVDWSLDHDNLQSALTDFLEKLKTFAESSVSQYEALQKSINVARDSYERISEFRR